MVKSVVLISRAGTLLRSRYLCGLSASIRQEEATSQANSQPQTQLHKSKKECIDKHQVYYARLTKGKTYSWCKCGLSKTQPFCDSSHKEVEPPVEPVQFILSQEDVDAFQLLCCCKQTATPPFCDGSYGSYSNNDNIECGSCDDDLVPYKRKLWPGIIAAKEPFCVPLKAGKKYAWCRCGLSKKQPFCDGSHKDSTLTPLRFTCEEEMPEAYLCGCKQTDTPPYCDGTHATPSVQES